MQDKLFAFYSREAALQRGVNIDKQVHNYRPTSELTLKDRRDEVNPAKTNSTCRECGKTGHRAGDEACPQRMQPDDKGKGKRTRKCKGKYTKFMGRIGILAEAINAEYHEKTDYCAPLTSPPPDCLLRPTWARGLGIAWTQNVAVEDDRRLCTTTLSAGRQPAILH